MFPALRAVFFAVLALLPVRVLGQAGPIERTPQEILQEILALPLHHPDIDPALLIPPLLPWEPVIEICGNCPLITFDPSSPRIVGTVVDHYGVGIVNARVTLYRDGDKEPITNTTTDTEGEFFFFIGKDRVFRVVAGSSVL